MRGSLTEILKILSTLKSTPRGEFYYKSVMKSSRQLLQGPYSGSHSHYSVTQVVYMSS